jgi:hypothetical protein
MKSLPQNSLRLSHPAAGPLSRARKQFNTLIKKLEAARALLAKWKETLPAAISKVDSEYQPLVEAHSARMKLLLLLLDEMHGHKLLGKRERIKLSEFIANKAMEFLFDSDDEVLKDLCKRHGGDDDDGINAERSADIRQMMESLLGAEFKGDIDVHSPKAMLDAFKAQLEERDSVAAPDPQPEAPRPKRPAELARERRQAAEAQRLQQSIREIYRKLVSQLHPDREPDDAERQRKTVLMQRVNVAYAANDMLGLLELQLEVEQIDLAGLANLGDERIKQYNKVLSEQLGELESEVAGIVEVASIEMGSDMFDDMTPAGVMLALDSDIDDLRIRIVMIDEDLQSLRDVKLLKAWLKALPKSTPPPDDILFW